MTGLSHTSMDTTFLDSLIFGRVEPFIYAFETNTVPSFLKVGDTYRPVNVRLDEWRKEYSDLIKRYEHTAKVDEDTYFRDFSVHSFLVSHGFRRISPDEVKTGIYYSNEFFYGAKGENVDQAITDIYESFKKKDNRYAFYNAENSLPLGDFDFKRDACWQPRENQQVVIDKFKEAVAGNRTDLLLYAVMRFGKSFTSLCCAKEMGARLVVVVCGKTAVRTEWKENVQRPIILDGFQFVDSDSLKRNPQVVTKKFSANETDTIVVFLTMQDLIGDDIKTRHEDLFRLNDEGKLDLLIIDETHFGARAEEYGRTLGTNKAIKISKQEKEAGYDDSADDLEQKLKVFTPKVKLHLSGTPYRILLDNEFAADDIVGSVQYSDIIDAKEKWDREHMDDDEWENPYYGFPQMIRFAFNLNKSSKERLSNLKNNGYAYDLSELLSTKSMSPSEEDHSQFKYEKEIIDLLRAIDGKESDDNIFSFLNYDKIENGKMCRHIVMVLPSCASCDAMEKLLQRKEFYHLNEYEIINIAGFNSPKSFKKADYATEVKKKIEELEQAEKKTISLTVGKMLTGSTVKEWDTMIFLRNTSSPQDYDQAVFRLQSQYVKTFENNGKIIKYDMKPQTVLVDFDPVRMLTLQHKKTLIANINKDERGNENLEKKLTRELEIAPIICINHNKLQKVEAADIVNEIRHFNENKSVMDETFDIEIDEGVFSDEDLLSIIKKQPEMTSKGVKFETSPNKHNDDEETDVATPETDSSPKNADEEKNNEKEVDDKNELAHRLQGFYFKLLLFAFLSENEIKTVSDIIDAIRNDPNGVRIGDHLKVDVSDLEVVRNKINPAILSFLENKIQNINQLGRGCSPEHVKIALKKLSRLSESEVVTPDDIVKKMIGSLPSKLNVNFRILDIASKTGEFSCGILQKYGNVVRNNVFCIPTSGLTYECTRKIYSLLNLPTDHIYCDFNAYDLIDETKNRGWLEELNKMRFDAIIGNPPYQLKGGSGGTNDAPIYQHFVEIAQSLKPKYASLIMPSKWFTAGRENLLGDFRKHMLGNRSIQEMTVYSDFHDVFPSVNIKGGLCYYLYNSEYSGDCEYKLIQNGSETRCIRRLDEFDILIQNPHVAELVKKVINQNDDSGYVSEIISNDTPFGIPSNPTKSKKKTFSIYSSKSDDHNIKLYYLDHGVRKTAFVRRGDISKNTQDIGKYKVFIPAAYGAGEDFPHQIVGQPEYGGKNSICSQTYLYAKFDTEREALNFISYLKTKTFRLLVLACRIEQHLPNKTYRFVPLQDFSKPWTDEELYRKYNLTNDEIAFIESMIKPMNLNGVDA